MITKFEAELNRSLLHEEAQKYSTAYLKGAEGLYPHEKKYLIQNKLKAAISGKTTLGVRLTQDKPGLAKASCIDIDTPTDAATITEAYQVALRLVELAKEFGLIAYIEYSGNKGYHVWLLSEAHLYWQYSVANNIYQKKNSSQTIDLEELKRLILWATWIFEKINWRFSLSNLVRRQEFLSMSTSLGRKYSFSNTQKLYIKKTKP